MKFKTRKDDFKSRTINLTDKDGVTLEVMYINDSAPAPVMISVNVHDEPQDIFGLSRAKALKLAWAIIDELNPIKL